MPCWLPALLLACTVTACRPSAGPPKASGTIEADEVRVASRYGGRVEAVHAREGAALTNGQLLVELDAAELRAQRAAAAASLAELEAGPRPQEIAAARQDWAALEAELELARTDAKRAQELFADNTISAADRDRAVARAETLAKSAAAAKSRYELLQAGTRPEQIAQARARLAEIDTRLRELRIVSPTNAVLEVLPVKVGDVLAPNRDAATLILPTHLWVRVYVPQPWLGFLQLGERVQVRVDSFPDRTFDGVVEQINRQAEFTPRNVQTEAERIKQVFGVKVALPNAEGQLRAGMSADVFFPNVPRAR